MPTWKPEANSPLSLSFFFISNFRFIFKKKLEDSPSLISSFSSLFRPFLSLSYSFQISDSFSQKNLKTLPLSFLHSLLCCAFLSTSSPTSTALHQRRDDERSSTIPVTIEVERSFYNPATQRVKLLTTTDDDSPSSQICLQRCQFQVLAAVPQII
ncbi:unnamed protein product [Camellia sinensis]